MGWSPGVSVFERLQQILHKDFDLPVEKLQREATLEDLEIDSLRMIEILFSVEEAFGITVQAEQNELRAKLKTLGDLADYIETIAGPAS
jgi:acyl carrier protein